MSLSRKLKKEVQEALRKGDALRVSTLRMLRAALHNAEIEKRGELTQEEEWEVVRGEAKVRKEAAEEARKAGREEFAQKEEAELAIIEEYLPEEPAP